MRVGSEASQYGMGVELVPKCGFAEISTSGESGGESVVVWFEVLRRVDLGE
jgi:hypothetical protein